MNNTCNFIANKEVTRYTKNNKQTDTSLDVKTPAYALVGMLGFLFYRCS